MPQLDRAVIRARAERLRAKGEEALHRFLNSLVGRKESAVIESGGRARLGNFAPVRLTQPGGEIGGVATLKILSREGSMLVGAPV